MSLSKAVREGSRIALSRVLSQVENNTAAGLRALDELFPYTGKAHKIGITGPPGSGKSTLVNALAKQLRQLENDPRVAIIAVDPTSPFSGGAILGDRVRMLDLQGDPDIFIRSMASRGALGGLATQTEALSQVFDAAGYDFILIETVGAGQSEVDIVNLAHTTIVVDVPGLGDDIQSIKAGILEIADILVVNKADRPGADQSLRYLKSMIDMGYRPLASSAGKHRLADSLPNSKPCDEDEQQSLWTPPVMKTVARESEGIETLVAEILKHQKFLKETGRWQLKEAWTLREIVRKRIEGSLVRDFFNQLPEGLLDETMGDVIARKVSPARAVENLLTYNRNRNQSPHLE
ncbi:MAG: methylmalonyl Co-A mutase-associated GTPase MeaB [Anaerolineaceae bacterium]|nr:methylmalonyl Co-A mutase-associated GTPase MeaB [Anaerolineaceae bacterium]MDD4042378.1 methylmalonyl Co-A mutase-associated GTPase MeaB [Anaerolineaceae bacterium]